MTRARKRLVLAAVSVAGLLLIAAGALVLTLRSQWFYNQVRERMIAEMERSTGGRVEIGRFDFNWTTLEAQAGPLVLHGTEGPGESPLFRADRIRARFTIISMALSGVRLSSLVIERPQVHLIVQPDGSTNFPGPLPINADQMLRNALDLGIGHFEVRNGFAQVNNRGYPFEARGDHLTALLNFDPRSREYAGSVSSDALQIKSPRWNAALASAAIDMAIRPGRVQISSARLSAGRSTLEASGVLQDFSSPRGELNLTANFYVAELGRIAPLPVEHEGEGKLRGKLVFAFGDERRYEFTGRITAAGLGWRSPDLRVAGISLAADLRVTPDRIAVPRITAAALGGSFSGSGSIEPRPNRFEIDGQVRNLSLAESRRLNLARPLPWSGLASGPVHVDGLLEPNLARTVSASARLVISPAPGQHPIQGVIDATYDGRTRSLKLAQVRLQTGRTRLEASGTVGEALHVAFQSGDLDDLTPALPMLIDNAPAEIPIQIQNSQATASGVVAGSLENPRFTGRVTLPAFMAQGRTFDRLSADIRVDRAHLAASNIELDQGAARITGSISSTLENWRVVPASTISASLKLRGVDVGALAAAVNPAARVGGTASADVELEGEFAQPRGSIQVTVSKPSLWSQTFDALQAALRLSPDSLEVAPASLSLGDARLSATGAYRRSTADWRNGSLEFHVSANRLPVNRVDVIRDFNEKITGRASLDVTGSGRVVNGKFEPGSINGEITGRELALNGAPLGSGEISAEMKGTTLTLRLGGSLRDTRIQGAGEWQLAGTYPGRAEIRFSPLPVATLRDLRGAIHSGGATLPFRGFIEGGAVISGPLDRPSAMKAAITISRLELNPNTQQNASETTSSPELTLRNAEPMRFELTSQELRIERARLTAPDTKIEATGRVAFNDQSPWDVTVQGGVNLAILRLFNTDLLAQGAAVVHAAVTGPLRDPEVTGKLELRNASLYVGGLPSGIDNLNGLVTFDRDRASIQKLTAEVGGGHVALGGFVGFGGGVLLYGVQANAEQVRLRNAEGATVTLNAALNLTGSSQKALVSGGVTILRAGFAPRSDLGALLAANSRPTSPAASPNEYLSSISYDIRIDSGPGMEFDTSLTHDIEANAELRLRGDAARPVLLGDISITQGDIVLFGNTYEINRGDIRFLNPTRIEPTVDIDLQTKARGITVNISFAGTLNNLKMTYRSDPPLQTNDIIALLAVGRDPMASAGLASSQFATQSTMFSTGPNIITQAISAPSSSRLQRFFGVSRLKIDPQLLGVENIPQARLTLEQQVSRDITITYVTNLSRTQEQIIRFEWDMNRQWSAVATREENGVFGVDFQFKTRLK